MAFKEQWYGPSSGSGKKFTFEMEGQEVGFAMGHSPHDDRVWNKASKIAQKNPGKKIGIKMPDGKLACTILQEVSAEVYDATMQKFSQKK